MYGDIDKNSAKSDTDRDNGELSERSKEAVLKTVEVQVSGGSNPSLSAVF